MLTPLKTLAERLGAAVVLVSHTTKGGSGNGKHRVLGSIAYVGACRANHFFVADPHDPTGRRVLMIEMAATCPRQLRTLAYVIEDRGKGPRVEWSDEPVAITIEEALKPKAAHSHNGGKRAALSSAKAGFVLFWPTESSPRSIVFKAGNTAGFSLNQIRRAKSRIKAVAMREGFGVDGQWSWGLGRHAITR